MEETIINIIKENNDFDGTYFQKYLKKPILFNDKEVIRVIVAQRLLMVHILDELDDTEFVQFSMLPNNIQSAIYADVTMC